MLLNLIPLRGSMRHFRLAVAQIAPTLGDLEKNLALHEKMARQAIEQSANLLVFPSSA